MINATSFSRRIFKAVSGFGNRSLGLARTASEVVGRVRGTMYENSVRLIPFAKTEPSPTIKRLVSGRNMNTRIKFRPERALRKPKIHHQPAFCAKTPPITGPMLGAAFGLMSLVRTRIAVKAMERTLSWQSPYTCHAHAERRYHE
jgi:hypothetical protein